MRRVLVAWLLLVCAPVKEKFLCAQVQDTSTGSLERLARAVTEDSHDPQNSTRQTVHLLTDEVADLEGRLNYLESTIPIKTKEKKP